MTDLAQDFSLGSALCCVRYTHNTEYTRAEVMAKIERAGEDAVKRDAVKAAKIKEGITRV